jgi:hypothetical protein
MSTPDENILDGFTLSRGPGGGLILMDSAFTAYLKSTAPDPSQASLSALFATRVRILGGGVRGDKAMGDTVWLELTEPAEVAAFASRLAINDDPARFDHCLCYGDAAIECYADGQEGPVATLGYHHGKLIRWARWKHDAPLADGRELARWLADRGLDLFLQDLDEQDRSAREYQEQQERWLAAMPPCLRPAWEYARRFGSALRYSAF